jgi:hypothetical protein
MPNLPNREARLAELIRLGVLPTIAEEAVQWAEARGQRVPTPAEAASEPGPEFAADLERSRQWWLYQPSVGLKHKRLLSARTVGDAK